MDFNTGGGSGRPDDRPLYGDETGGSARGPERGPVGGAGGEFNLQDPVNSFVDTVRRVALDPAGFFRGIPKRGDFVSPLVFAIVCAVINGVLGGILGFLISLVSYGDPDFGVGAALAGLIGSIILTPVFTVIGLFIGAGIFHLLTLLFVRPANAGFEATFRVVAYTSVTQLVTWLAAIPFLGILIALVAAVYTIYLNVVGIREVHATTTGRAALIVLIPAAVLLLFVLLIFGAALLFIFSAANQGQF